MIPVLLHIGPIPIYSYGLMMAMGFLAADLITTREFRRYGYDPERGSTLVVWCAIGGLAGSRVYDIIENLPNYLAHPSDMIFSGSGFVWFGGLMGGVVASILVARYYKIAWLKISDIAAPALVMGHAIGRIGCQLSGDGDWGRPSTLPWAMAYPHAIVGWNAQTVLTLDSHGNLVSGWFPGVRVHPAPVYETIVYLGVFAILWSIRKKGLRDGQMFSLYLILAGAARFAVEFVRINPRVAFGLSGAQVIGLLMVALGIAGYYYFAAGAPARAEADSRPQSIRAQRAAQA